MTVVSFSVFFLLSPNPKQQYRNLVQKSNAKKKESDDYYIIFVKQT